MISARLVLAAALALPALLDAAVVGTNPPSWPLTAERIATLPADQQPAWRDYLRGSIAQRDAERAFFAAELKAHHITTPVTPAEGRGGGLSLTRPAEWCASDEARRLADHVLSFQTPSGGWSKNLDYADHPRRPGERFAPGNTASAAVAPLTATNPSTTT